MRNGAVLVLLLAAMMASAQDETTADEQKEAIFGSKKDGSNQGVNQLDIDLNLLGRGEMRFGGFTEGAEENRAQFLMERTRLSLDYKRPYIEAKVTAQHSGVWGQSGKGSFNLHEAWAQLTAKNGLFLKMGRQVLSYDDERVIGANDWAMAANSHDVIKFGYEGHGHKVHAIFGFNQNAESISGGSLYTGDSYKMMHTLWYHFDFPKIPIGASLLFMNIGMQGDKYNNVEYKNPCNRYQQLVGGYLSYKPGKLTAEASYYHQLGRTEENSKLDAWMASIKAQYQISRKVGVLTGYDCSHGDLILMDLARLAELLRRSKLQPHQGTEPERHLPLSGNGNNAERLEQDAGTRHRLRSVLSDTEGRSCGPRLLIYGRHGYDGETEAGRGQRRPEVGLVLAHRLATHHIQEMVTPQADSLLPDSL